MLINSQLKQLTMDNVVPEPLTENHITLGQLFEDASLGSLTSVHEVLPMYL